MTDSPPFSPSPSPSASTSAQAGGIAGDRLRSFIERIERLEMEKAQTQDFIKEVFDEAKATGFDIKIMRQIIRLRKLDADAIAEQDHLLDLYKQALGMIA